MHVKIVIQGELVDFNDLTVVEALRDILDKMLPHMIDNVRVEVLVDGLPY